MSTKIKIIVAVVILVAVGVVAYLIYKDKKNKKPVKASKVTPDVKYMIWGFNDVAYEIPEDEFAKPNSPIADANIISRKFSDEQIEQYLKKFRRIN